ncbi:Phenylalanine--tRNA ligase beta subunit [Candidatus Cyrtobacter comes]|uniref:Phenylalanine--tRNA ligase beta subunit n=1 Tax=Candidatus Cyrtobacter comes TaxID=675776 RepID=A0ABU5L7A4_9RICK|nr:phenylalanine--tRNA ligase subunit beta [Candidatus Cyrtobacter comes]MDZ5762006.1 Phenylalanine--tRNA ligase beta subunit [Candidatus Cyrtobacter comes]
MKISLSLIKNYIEYEYSVEHVINMLNNIGMEVEDVVYQKDFYKEIQVALIKEAEKHPNADKLRVCKVFDGKNEYQIVCGAPNARAGIKVAFAYIGAKIPKNGFIIKESEIRGVKSLGMLCSQDELSLGVDYDGILELPQDAVLGAPVAEYLNLNEVIFDIAITPNRGDAASAVGIARDLAAAGLGKNLSPKVNESFDISPNFDAVVEDREGCFGMEFIKIQNVSCNEYAEISSIIQLLGIQSRGTLVDISNFTMLSYGRPNHIYDADKVSGKITVRKSQDKEIFEDLTGKKHELSSGITVISDEEKILSVAGLIGGRSSMVDSSTKNIIIELGLFSQKQIGKAEKALGISTDASFRFVRGIDYGNTKLVKEFLVNLIKEKCAGVPTSYFSYSIDFKDKLIPLRYESLLKIAGHDIPNYKEILKNLGFSCADGLLFKVPSYRYWDINIEEDLIEEVLRIYGFGNIEEKPLENITPVLKNNLDDYLRKTASKIGLNEVVSWSFCDKLYATCFANEDSLIELENPITQEFSFMRPSIIPTILKTVCYNISHSISSCAMFEIGKVYHKSSSDLIEKRVLATVRTNLAENKNIFCNERKLDFFDAKSDLSSFLEEFGIAESELSFFRDHLPGYYHPTRSASVFFNGRLIAYCGELHPKLISDLKIGTKPIVAVEIFLDELKVHKNDPARYNFTMLEYQPVYRDFCFIIDEGVSFETIRSSILNSARGHIESIRLVDIFKNSDIPQGKHSVTINLMLRNKNHTFDEAQLTALSNNIIEKMEKECGAILKRDMLIA